MNHTNSFSLACSSFYIAVPQPCSLQKYIKIPNRYSYSSAYETIYTWKEWKEMSVPSQVLTWLYCGQEGIRSQISVTATSTRNCHSDRPMGFNETRDFNGTNGTLIRAQIVPLKLSFQIGHLIFKLWMLCLSCGFRKLRRGIIKAFLLFLPLFNPDF